MADSEMTAEFDRVRRRADELQRRLAESAAELVSLKGRLEQETTARHEAVELLRQEIAVRQQVEKRLRESQQRVRDQDAELQTIYDSCPGGLCMVDADLQFASVNQRLAEIAGLSMEAFRGRQVREVFPSLADRIEPLIRHVLDTGESLLDVELTGPAPNDRTTLRTWLLSYYPLKHEDEPPVGVCGIIRDITTQRQAEEALRQGQRLWAEAEKLAATGRMAARIAHEINNPLAGIKNSFLLVKKAVPKEHPRYEFVGLIEKEIDRIAEIVRQMYDLHRPNQEVEREILVADTVRDVVTMLQPLSKRHRVTIDVEMADAELLVCLPEGSLRQVLYNLLSNAIEASPCDGCVRIDVQHAEDTLWVSVMDQGRGVPLELRSRIFEPFFTTKENETSGGLGLGLSICKGFVEALQGSIELQSEMGGGSVFRVKLPLHRRNPALGE